MKFMSDIIAEARAYGYSPVRIHNRIKNVGCPQCRKNRAVLFDGPDGRRVLACPCGCRKRVGDEKPTVVDTRCKAYTKAGRRCKNKAMHGSDYCGAHQPKTRRQGDVK